MAEATMIEGLSGVEIIDDILAQTKRKLQTSCNLREADSYGQGYSAEVTVKIKTYAMDVQEEEFAVSILAKFPPPVASETVTVTPVEVNETLTIPQELDLDAVRERLKAPEPLPPPTAEEEGRMPERLKRKYNRRLPSFEQPSMGGAVDLDDQPEVKF